jgi:hypothetical protein
MNVDTGDIKRLSEFEPGDTVKILTDEQAELLMKIDKEERSQELARLQRLQFKGLA